MTGRPFYDMLVDGKKFRLAAQNREAAEAEAAQRYTNIIAGARRTCIRLSRPHSRAKAREGLAARGIALYRKSYTSVSTSHSR